MFATIFLIICSISNSFFFFSKSYLLFGYQENSNKALKKIKNSYINNNCNSLFLFSCAKTRNYSLP